MAPPSPFVVDWVPRVAAALSHADALPATAVSSGRPTSRRGLDVAMGRGRHAPVLARSGFTPFGVDIAFDALRDARAAAQQDGIPLRCVCADLTAWPLLAARFDLVLVTRYLDRARMPALQSTVRAGGFVIYETFTQHQVRLGRGPTSPHHLLAPGELADWFAGWDVGCYDEVLEPEAVARLVARKRAGRRANWSAGRVTVPGDDGPCEGSP